MKVLVNGVMLLAPQTGIGRYIRYLFSELSSFDDVDLLMYSGLRCEKGFKSIHEKGQNGSLKTPSALASRLAQTGYALAQRLVPRPRELRRLFERATFSYHAGRCGEAIYHEPSFFPLPYRGPTVLTVHDLSCFDHPETQPSERVEFAHRELPRAIERADHIIVISESTRDAVIRHFGVSRERMTVTHLAADSRFVPRGSVDLRPILHNFMLAPKQYVLYVGTLEPRKNLISLFSAYAGLPSRLRQRFPLVVAGMNGWLTDSLKQASEPLVRSGELRLLGYVPDASIPALYSGAAAFAYPSLYEGFGLPVLEAMASGVPVLTTNRTSLPEVVGNAGLMTDPDDIDGMQRSLHRLLDDRSFAEQMGVAGMRRAADFSWEKCARDTYGAYKKVLPARGPCR